MALSRRWPRPQSVVESSCNLFQLWQKLLAQVTAAAERGWTVIQNNYSIRAHDSMSGEADAGETFQLLRGGNDTWTAIWSLELKHEDTFISLSKYLNACDVEIEVKSERLLLSYISRVGVAPHRPVANFTNYAITNQKVCFIPRFPRSLWWPWWLMFFFNENQMLTSLPLYSSATTEGARIRISVQIADSWTDHWTNAEKTNLSCQNTL